MNDEKIKALLDSLPDEQREKAAACKSNDELFALLGELGVELSGELGVELSDELMDKIAGGGIYGPRSPGHSVQPPPVIL